MAGPAWRGIDRPVRAQASAQNQSAPARSGYAGDQACVSCHADVLHSYHQTAHFLTSQMPSQQTILGSFATGQNVLKTANPNLSFRMEKRLTDGKPEFLQTAIIGAPGQTHERTEAIAFVIGSGGKGQTYLYWDYDLLFELPVSYWKDLGWVNSPGYRDGVAEFDRPILPRCLDCHATYFQSLNLPVNRYAATGMVLGIGCEKCHGPGQKHVDAETSNPGSAAARTAILNPARFPRERQMDLCAWCHAGQGDALAPVFSYQPGQPLEKYIRLPVPDPNAPPDVHDNQVALLQKSRCFQASEMTCLTCHNPHAAQHDLAAFSRVCLGCHKPESATFARAGHPVTSNCIDCHMPSLKTNLIVFNEAGKSLKPEVRSHWIRIYAAER